MHPTQSLLLLALPSLITAQSQKPLGEKVGDNLQNWLNKVKTYLPASVTSPVDTGAAKVAAKNVTPLTKDNWQSVLSPSSSAAASSGPETWMVFVTGGNKTCYGQCGGVEAAWNESATAFAADPTAPNLASLNCDTAAVLCTIWAAGPPAIWHIEVPVTSVHQSRPATTIHIVPLNATTSTAQEIIEIHYGKTYEKRGVYEGAFHPFDGWLAKYGLNVPLGYVLFGFSMVPSWMFMILISFVSRTVMYVYICYCFKLDMLIAPRNRRVGNPNVARAEAQRRAQPQGGAPAANQ